MVTVVITGRFPQTKNKIPLNIYFAKNQNLAI